MSAIPTIICQSTFGKFAQARGSNLIVMGRALVLALPPAIDGRLEQRQRRDQWMNALQNR